MKRKQVHLLLLALVAVFAAFMELGFRSYLYKQPGIPVLIAGSLPNFVAVALLSLIFLLIRDGQKGISSLRVTTMAVIAMVIYEFVQPLIPGRVFDYYDIAASILGGFFIYGLLSIVDYYKPVSLR